MVRTRGQTKNWNTQTGSLDHENTENTHTSSPGADPKQPMLESEKLDEHRSTTPAADLHSNSPKSPMLGKARIQEPESDTELRSDLGDDVNNNANNNATQCSDNDRESALQEPAPKARRGRPAGAKIWQSWEERALAHEFNEQELWKLSLSKRAEGEVWERLAAAVKRKTPEFNCTGTACSVQFPRMLRREKKVEARVLQTTGEGEDIDNHCELMEDILSRLRNQETRKEV
ncbi:hypothetical protein RSOL_312830, partial [Rhizoctonia solani AG-3 Rhs1AP]